MRSVLSALACFALACASAEPGPEVCAVPELAGVAPELLFATTVPAGSDVAGPAVLGALRGAAPEGHAFVARDALGRELGRMTAGEGGAMIAPLPLAAGDTVDVEAAGAGVVRLVVRDAAQARAAAVRPSIDGAGSVPNDLVIFGPPERARGVLVRSGDNAVSVFDLERGLEGSTGVRLPEIEGRCGPRTANPWFAAPIDDARVAVTAFGQDRVYVVDLDRATIERVLEVAADVALASPFALPRALDLDCDGVPEETLTRVSPRAPQGIAKVGERLVVAFSGFVEPRIGASPPVYVPAVLAIWEVSALDAAPSLHVLPALNAQEVRALDARRVLVTASGVLDPIGGAVAASTPGAVTIFDVEARAIERSFVLDDFAPGTALVAGDALWVGSLVRGAVRALDPDDGTILAELSLSTDDVDSVMRLVELPGGLVAAPSFNSDRLFVIDAARRVLSPPPFFGPLQVGPGRPLFDGLQVLARRPGRSGVDFCGPELFALSGLASRVVPIELRRILGP